MLSGYSHLLAFLTLTYFSYVSVLESIYFNHCFNEKKPSFLRMDSGVIYPEAVSSVEDVARIRDLLLGNTKSPWVQLAGENTWAKLIKIGVLYRNSRKGMASEATREGAPPGSEHELFHMYRLADCKVTGSRNADYLGLNQGPRAVSHVGRFSFTDNAVVAVPLANFPGPVSVVTSLRHSKKAIVGLAIFALSLMTKLKHVLSELDLHKAASGAISYLCSVILGNIAWGFNVVEGGMIDGITAFYWEEHPYWAEWVARGLLYVAVVWYYGGYHKLWGLLTKKGYPGSEWKRLLRIPLPILRIGRVKPTVCTWLYHISALSCVRLRVMIPKRS